MTETTHKKGKGSEVDVKMQEVICDLFWKTSNRKKNWLKAPEIGPSQFHQWGTLNNISGKSPTLANLVKERSTEGLNHQSVFKVVLDELGLAFNIYELKPEKKQDTLKIVSYDIESVPRWSFTDCALTRAEASAGAAKRGLEFFMALAE